MPALFLDMFFFFFFSACVMEVKVSCRKGCLLETNTPPPKKPYKQTKKQSPKHKARYSANVL